MIFTPRNNVSILKDSIEAVSHLRRLAWEFQHKNGQSVADYRSMFQKLPRVCLLASSSRGGTSVTSELLQWQGADCSDPNKRLLSLPGEEKPFLILAGLAFPSRTERFDDLSEIDAKMVPISKLLSEMGSEIGYPVFQCDDLELYAIQLYRRLLLQWPVDLIEVEMHDAIASLTKALQASFPHGYHDNMDNRRKVLEDCVRCFPFIRPSFYDCWPSHAQEDALNLAGNFWSIEETPFVLPPPWHNANTHDLKHGCLLLRDPSNAWRLPFWRAVFLYQNFHILHLVRDPRESVQGLCDGWNYPFGFQTLPSEGTLSIIGYTDETKHERHSWKQHRLNFSINKTLSRKLLDESQRASLVQVCAFQWIEAHRSILEEAERLSLSRTIINFADLRNNTVKTFRDICSTLNLECSKSGLAFARSFPDRWVMATVSAKNLNIERWRNSTYANEIKSLVELGYFDEVSTKLGLGSISTEPEPTETSNPVESSHYVPHESNEDKQDHPPLYA